MNSSDLDRPVFVVGVPRSGTTLVSTILSSSKELCVTPEIWFYNYWKPKYRFLNFKIRSEYEFFVNRFLSSDRFGFLELDARQVEKDILSSEYTPSFEVVFATTLIHYARRLEKNRVGEKTPGQFQNIAELLELYPDSRIICMLRDPLAVAASTLESSFGSKRISKAANRWVAYSKLIERFCEHERVMILRYEDVVLNFKDVAPTIRQFLDIELADDAHRSNRSGTYLAGSRSDAWANEHFDRSMQPINANSLEKWRSRLSENEKSIVWQIVEAEARRLEYVPNEFAEFAAPSWYQSTQEFFRAKLESVVSINNRLSRSPKLNRIRYRIQGTIPEQN